MKNPLHPGLLVEECLDDVGLSVAEAAKGLGVTRQQLHNLLAGRRYVTPEMAIRFEKANVLPDGCLWLVTSLQPAIKARFCSNDGNRIPG